VTPNLPEASALAGSHVLDRAGMEEAAAVIAAVERFLRDTAPPPAEPEPKPSPWVRAALLEGVNRDPWG
jgi:hypothetical protein